MKKDKWILRLLVLPLFLAFLSIPSCTKKLTEHVYSSETSGNYYATADQVTAAYVQPYSFLQTLIYSVHFAVEEFPTDEAVVTVKAGQGYENGQWIRFHQHSWTSGEDFLQYEWSNMFQGIGYCNNFIDAMENRDVSKFNLPLSKDQMIAETKLMRAMYYYWAMNDFGNIPVVDHLGVQSPPTQPRAQVFAFIEQEIKNNIGQLGEKGDATWYGHFTKTAAHALLAKLYLNAEVFTGTARWDDCITECDSVINSGLYSLDSTWQTPFLVNNQTSNENIWVVPFDAQYAPGFNATIQQTYGALKDKYYFSDYPWSKVVTQESFFDLYSSNDKRINQWLVGPQYYADSTPVLGWYDQDSKPFVIYPHIDMLNNANGGYGQGVCNEKYQIQPTTAGNPIPDNMNNDLVVFRLADIMMMKAECLMRKAGGSTPQTAVDLVNAVRARAFDAGAQGAAYTTATLTMDEMLNERGREFAYEMKRREDLIRFGKFEQAWWEKPADGDKHREIFPVPRNILTVNPALKQNPGYQ